MEDAKEKRMAMLLYETLQMLRKEMRHAFGDWKDADDYIFANLSFTKEELRSLYADKNEMVYTGSAEEG